MALMDDRNLAYLLQQFSRADVLANWARNAGLNYHPLVVRRYNHLYLNEINRHHQTRQHLLHHHQHHQIHNQQHQQHLIQANIHSNHVSYDIIFLHFIKFYLYFGDVVIYLLTILKTFAQVQ